MLRVSSSNARLHVGHRFIAVTLVGSAIRGSNDDHHQIENQQREVHENGQTAGDDPNPGKLFSTQALGILFHLREGYEAKNQCHNSRDRTKTHPSNGAADYSQHHRGGRQTLVLRLRVSRWRRRLPGGPDSWFANLCEGSFGRREARAELIVERSRCRYDRRRRFSSRGRVVNQIRAVLRAEAQPVFFESLIASGTTFQAGHSRYDTLSA